MRLGIFTLSKVFIAANQSAVQRFLAKCTVISKLETAEDITYTAANDDFDELVDGEATPTYAVRFPSVNREFPAMFIDIQRLA